MALLDSTGALLPPPYEPWCDPNASDEEKARRRRPASPPPPSEGQDAQYAVLCSEKQAKVVSMATQSGVHKHSITEASFVLRADVVHVAGAYCIACFCANGHIMALRYDPTGERRFPWRQNHEDRRRSLIRLRRSGVFRIDSSGVEFRQDGAVSVALLW